MTEKTPDQSTPDQIPIPDSEWAESAPAGTPYSPADLGEEEQEQKPGGAERPRSKPIGRPMSPEVYERQKRRSGAPDPQTECAQEDSSVADDETEKDPDEESGW